MYGFPASVVAKVITLLGTPRSLSNILGNRRPMRHPLKEDVTLGLLKQGSGIVAHGKHLLVDRTF